MFFYYSSIKQILLLATSPAIGGGLTKATLYQAWICIFYCLAERCKQLCNLTFSILSCGTTEKVRRKLIHAGRRTPWEQRMQAGGSFPCKESLPDLDRRGFGFVWAPASACVHFFFFLEKLHAFMFTLLLSKPSIVSRPTTLRVLSAPQCSLLIILRSGSSSTSILHTRQAAARQDRCPAQVESDVLNSKEEQLTCDSLPAQVSSGIQVESALNHSFK